MNQDELEAVQSLFCLPGECVIRENEVTINFDLDGLSSSNSSRPDSVKIIFHLEKNYPRQFPQISVFSETLDREAVSRVKSKVLQSCTDLLGEPMIISLISAVRENVQLEFESKHFSTLTSNNSQSADDDSCSNCDKIWTTILHIDHMRSKNKYCKTLEKWASDLNLCGKILFCNKLILVLLQGEVENIKDFVVRLKTVSIDVDSKGHSCKERMMTVLCEKQNNVTDITRLEYFERKEVANKEELEKIFCKLGLVSLYKEHVCRIH